MIKMNVIVRLTILTISYGISTIHAQSNPGITMPGSAGCMYYGSIDQCKQTIVEVNTLPPKCLSLFFDGVFIDETYAIHYSYADNDVDHLKDLIYTSKPVFLSIAHEMGYPWSAVLDDPNDFKLNSEIQSIGTYLDYMGVNGVVLKNVFEKDNANLKDLKYKLMRYVVRMQECFPFITIGLEIDAKVILDQTEHSKICFLDFNVLCEVFDFFKITFDGFNKCTDEYLNGIVPVDNKPGNTLKKLSTILSTAGVSKEQLYYAIHLSPQVNNHQGPACSPTYGEKCKKCLNTEYPTYCMDTSETFYEKGQFINKNAAGFIGVYVDAIDNVGDCKCSVLFPAFQFILNGYNGDNKITCTIFDEPYTN